MKTEELRKEQHILSLMRKTLGNVVRDVTPLGGWPNPLTESTIQNIKDCFALISELAEKLNFDQAKPYYRDDEQPHAKVIGFVSPTKE